MKRAARWILNGVAGLSLVLALATVAAWAVGGIPKACRAVEAAGAADAYALEAWGEGVAFVQFHAGAPLLTPAPRWAFFARRGPAIVDFTRNSGELRGRIVRTYEGHAMRMDGMPDSTFFVITVPYALPAIAFSVLPAVVATRWWRRRRFRQGAGFPVEAAVEVLSNA